MIDHLVFAAANLESAAGDIGTLLGSAPTPGGRHLGHGTHNALLSLGGATYLEVIGPDPAQPEPEGPRPFGIDELVTPALVAWCVRPRQPLAEVLAAARAIGIDFGEVTAMSRRRPDGVLLEWELTFPQLAGAFGCALPFLIDWGTSAHPTESLPNGVRLTGFEVQHPDAQRLRAALDILGVTSECDLQSGPRPALTARLQTAHGDVTLTS